MSTTGNPSSKSICHLFFGRRPHNVSSNTWKCKCGLQRKCNVVKFGYNNLMTHIKAKHPDYQEIYAVQSSATKESDSQPQEVPQLTLNYMIDTKSRFVYKWIDWIVMDEHELNFCEKSRTRENSKLGVISSKTLRKYIFKLVNEVEKKITSFAAEASRYALVFDGWTEDSTHFIGKIFLVSQLRHKVLTH